MAVNSLNCYIVTLFPEMFSALNYGIVGRAMESGLLNCSYINPRDYTDNRQKRVDDSPYGGGPGQVMQVQPLRAAINACKQQAAEHQLSCQVIYLSPQGKLLNQHSLQQLFDCYSHPANKKAMILISGRYEGIDERLIQQDVDEEYSIGDYVLSGGELPTMVLIDALTRLHPAALGSPESAQQDSFANVTGLLDYPHYTRPEIIDGQSVPPVLLSGNHQLIRLWRFEQALKMTHQKRPELLKNIKKIGLNSEEQLLLENFLKSIQE